MNAGKFVTVALVATCAFALAACDSGSSETKPSPPINSSTIPPSGTSPAPFPERSMGNEGQKYRPASEKGPAENVPLPEFSDKAKVNSPDGAKAFIEYYAELINYVAETNDTQEIKKYTSRNCKECAVSIIDPADYSKSIDEWVVGGEYEFHIIDTYQPKKSNAIITTIFTSKPFKTYQDPGKVIGEYSEVSETYGTFQVEFKNGWKVVEFLVEDNQS
ncbi:DUF6318 family protein [Glutamicibacter sp.]|uniref:DUF6318 family protein n=1 Tax=Glutamicibacter sp. TaxID=1931995 RepID=UPI0028BE380E|nr:DUF6318 family protein [Glutamicibacter sp.]